MNTRGTTILAGDIGGTKTVLALYKERDGTIEALTKTHYPSREYGDFSDIIKQFVIKQASGKIDAACFGIAGPVIGGVCRTTNLPWEISTQTLRSQLGTMNIRLLNDLEATAYGMLYLDESDFRDLNPSAEDRVGNRAVIAAGTGLGEAMLYRDGDGYRPVGSEGGHADFAPTDPLQSRLLSWLWKRHHGHVSIERVLSGPGIYTLYEFLREEGAMSEPEFMRSLPSDADRSAAVSRGALEMNDPLCIRTLELFTAIYGAEAGNLALKTMAVGGIYVGGGVAPKILPFLEAHFMNHFLAKGRFEPLLRTIPVRVSLRQDTALIGAAHYAKDRLLPLAH